MFYSKAQREMVSAFLHVKLLHKFPIRKTKGQQGMTMRMLYSHLVPHIFLLVPKRLPAAACLERISYYWRGRAYTHVVSYFPLESYASLPLFAKQLDYLSFKLEILLCIKYQDLLESQPGSNPSCCWLPPE